MAHSATGPFKVLSLTDSKEISAFGEARTTTLCPVAGWTFSYNIIDELVTTSSVNSGSVTQTSGRAKLSIIGSSSEAKVLTKKAVRYLPGIGGLVRATCLWETAPAPGNFRIIGLGNNVDGLFFGTSGSSFGITHRVNSIDTFYSQSAWSDNTCPWLDISKGNLYQINYQWLGFGEIKFDIEDPATGRFVPVHRIKYANTSVSCSLLNPNLPVKAHNYNTFATGSFVMYSPSAMGFVENPQGYLPVFHDPLTISRHTLFARNSVSAEAVLIVLQSTGSLNGITNRMNIDLTNLNLTTDGTKVINFKIIRNPTLGGATPVYTNILLNQSPMNVSTTAGITYTGGTERWAMTLMKNDRVDEDLSPWIFELAPGETVILTAQSVSSVDIDGAIQWYERY